MVDAYLVINHSYYFELILAKSTSLEVDYMINPFYLWFNSFPFHLIKYLLQ